MEIFRIRISKSKLAQIPDDERTFYLLIGHLANELNILSKLFIYCFNFDSTNKVLKRVHRSQGMVIAKVLIGKAFEGWELLQTAFFGTRLSRQYEPLLDLSAKQALDSLKRYFGKKNLLKTVRNKFSFHYSLEDFRSGFASVPDSEELDIYLARSNANGLYYASDIIATYALLEMIEPGNYQLATDRLFQETKKVVGWFVEFIGGCMYVVTEKYFLDANGKLVLDPIDVGEVPWHDAVKIPYFSKKRK